MMECQCRIAPLVPAAEAACVFFYSSDTNFSVVSVWDYANTYIWKIGRMLFMGVLSQFDPVAPSPPRERAGGSGGGGSGGLPGYRYRERTVTRYEVAARTETYNRFLTFRFPLPFEVKPTTSEQSLWPHGTPTQFWVPFQNRQNLVPSRPRPSKSGLASPSRRNTCFTARKGARNEQLSVTSPR
jgi:hypothetical protein